MEPTTGTLLPTHREHAQVAKALMHRELTVMVPGLWADFIDTTINSGLATLLYAYCFPLMGIELHRIAPLYIGTIIQVSFLACFSGAINLVFDLRYSRFIDYHLTLPISKWWLITVYSFPIVIRAIILSTPPALLALLLFQNTFTLTRTSILLFCILYLFALLFLSAFFLAIAFNSSYNWFMSSVWPRLLDPIEMFGCVFFAWTPLYYANPVLAYCTLLSPLTHVTEGLRAAVLPENSFFSPYFCLIATIIFYLISLHAIQKGMKKSIDPV